MPGILYNYNFVSNGRRTNAVAWLVQHTLAHIPDRGWAAFAFSVAFTAFCFIPVWILYRKKIFLKI
jgi:hypothetical protein